LKAFSPVWLEATRPSESLLAGVVAGNLPMKAPLAGLVARNSVIAFNQGVTRLTCLTHQNSYQHL
jgi:hypothetical protein